MQRKLLLYLYSTPNIVGSVLGLSGMGLFFAGLIEQFWLLIVIGMYAVGAVGWPRQKRVELETETGLQLNELKPALDKLFKSVRRNLTADVVAKLSSVVELLSYTIEKSADASVASNTFHVVSNMVTNYLPNTLQSYLNLPPAYRRMHVVKGNKTAKDLLIDQLTILEEEMKILVEDLHKQDVKDMVAHGQFLQTKFKTPDFF